MPHYTMGNGRPSLLAALFWLIVGLASFVYSLYFFYRIAVTVHAWPFG